MILPLPGEACAHRYVGRVVDRRQALLEVSPRVCKRIARVREKMRRISVPPKAVLDRSTRVCEGLGRPPCPFLCLRCVSIQRQLRGPARARGAQSGPELCAPCLPHASHRTPCPTPARKSQALLARTSDGRPPSKCCLAHSVCRRPVRDHAIFF
jgi:hypothetical protein